MSNLQTLCKKCHEKKTGRPLYDWREGKKLLSRSTDEGFTISHRVTSHYTADEAQMSAERAIWEAEKDLRAAERERLRILLDPTLQEPLPQKRKLAETEARPSSYPIDGIMAEPFECEETFGEKGSLEPPVLDQHTTNVTQSSTSDRSTQGTHLAKLITVLLMITFGTLCLLAFVHYWNSFGHS